MSLIFFILKVLKMLRNLTCYLALFICLCSTTLFADNGGYKITVQLDNFTQPEAYLAGYIGDTPYILDTVQMENNQVVGLPMSAFLQLLP